MIEMQCNILICGGGIVGLTIAKELLEKGFENIIVIDKEPDVACHASGRNSGVLHSGIYYDPDSLKARFCYEGNLMMKHYCREKNINVLDSGKVVIAQNDEELETLHHIMSKAKANNVPAEFVTKKELNDIEPLAKTHETALFSPATAMVNPLLVSRSLKEELIVSSKVRMMFNTQLINVEDDHCIATTAGKIRFNLCINASGAHSDKIAKMFKVAKHYQLIPFKGTYKIFSSHNSALVKGNIYPVPNLKNPFLGVHFTRSFSGDVYVGPTGIPAFGRENYGVISGIDSEFFDILYKNAVLFLRHKGFRTVALSEPKKYLLRCFYDDAKRLVKSLDISELQSCDKVGIRPQLVDWKTKQLVMDFKIVRSKTAVHILNAISPAFTSSFSFAKYFVETYIK